MSEQTLVHNHGPLEGPGWACREHRVNGRLVGECLANAPASPPSPAAAPPDAIQALRDVVADVTRPCVTIGCTTCARHRLHIAIADLESRARTLQGELEEMRAAKDGAYGERNRVVAALARLHLAQGFRVGLKDTQIEGWDPEWQGCVYVETPAGQMSWHFHASQRHLFDGLPPYDGAWDGHSTPEKYDRLSKLTGRESMDTILWAAETLTELGGNVAPEVAAALYKFASPNNLEYRMASPSPTRPAALSPKDGDPNG